LQSQNEESVSNGIILLAQACVRIEDGRVAKPCSIVQSALNEESQVNI
jgi:hypothetical protein